MWITGFDVPTCSTIYPDKPMRNHTLMQTIARANRVYEGKNSGTIVDYIGVFRNLQAALAIYGTGREGAEAGEKPIKPKEALLQELAAAIDEARQFVADHGGSVAAIANNSSDIFIRIKHIEDAVEGLMVNDDTRNADLNLAAQVERLFKAILTDDRANPYLAPRAAVKAIGDTIRSEIDPADISSVMAQVADLLDRSIAGFALQEKPDKPFDLSQIDFEALRQQFARRRKRTEAMKLRGKLNVQSQRMVRLNKTRADLAKKFEALVDAYNEGRLGVDEFFERLLAFAQEMQAEEQRKVAKQLNEEELVIYDLLLKPRPELTRAAVQLAIEEYLDKLPATYEADLWQQKVQQVYAHFYDNYYGNGRSVYARLGLAA